MPIKLITRELLDETSRKAKESPRLRMNHNFHDQLSDPVNRMLNALEPGTILPIHRHLTPPRVETYVVLRGEVDALIYDDAGKLMLRETLNPLKGKYGIDIPAGTWHSLDVKLPDTVIYEVKEGPFVPMAESDFL